MKWQIILFVLSVVFALTCKTLRQNLDQQWDTKVWAQEKADFHYQMSAFSIKSASRFADNFYLLVKTGLYKPEGGTSEARDYAAFWGGWNRDPNMAPEKLKNSRPPLNRRPEMEPKNGESLPGKPSSTLPLPELQKSKGATTDFPLEVAP